MKRDFIDHHCHLLPSVDDGSTDLRESVEMARILAGFGFVAVHCTPHRIKGCYDNLPDKVRQATRYLQRLVFDAGVNLRLVPSTEHYLDEFLIDQLADPLTTGPYRCLLVEAPFTSGSQMIPAMVAGIVGRGMVPLIAHPERCSAFEPAAVDAGLLAGLLGRQKKPDMEGAFIVRMREAGCRFQGNLGSFAGFYGSEVRQRAVLFLQHGLYSCLGSDAHRSDRLAQMLTAGLETVVATVGEDAAHRLLSGQDLEKAGERH